MGCLRAKVERIGGIVASAVSAASVSASAIRIGGIKTSASLVCEVGRFYLQASPKTLWVSPELIESLLIESNVNWVIE